MKQVRICEFCGHHNSLGTTFCENPECGEDVSYLPITNLEEKEEEKKEEPITTVTEEKEPEPMKTVRMTGIRLVNSASGYELDIPVDGGIIGRSGTIHPEHFQGNLYISNKHAEISLAATGYTIKDLNSTNGTKVNNQRLTPDVEVPIKDGDQIVFANQQYIVKGM